MLWLLLLLFFLVIIYILLPMPIKFILDSIVLLVFGYAAWKIVYQFYKSYGLKRTLELIWDVIVIVLLVLGISMLIVAIPRIFYLQTY